MVRHVLHVSPSHPRYHRSITEALALARTDTIINVWPGQYAENVVLTAPVTITAEGGRGTVVVEPAAGSAVVMKAARATLSGVILRGGDDDSAVVDVPAGRLHLDDCEVHGSAWAAVLARRDAGVSLRGCRVENPAGSGIVATGTARAVVERTAIERIGASAVYAGEDASLELLDSTVAGARGNGLVATDRARGVVERCDVSGTEQPAVVVQKDSAVRIADSHVHDTKDVGIYLTGTGETEVEDCRVSDTGGHGLQVANGAAPHVRRTRVTRSRGSGLHIGSRAQGRYEECEIEDAGATALWVGGQSDPVLDTLLVRDCSGTGVTLADESTATMSKLTVRHVQEHGIVIRDGANPLVRSSTVTDCSGHGIVVIAGGRGRIEDCTVSETRYAALRTADGGHPYVSGTRVTGGPDVGVLIGAGGQGALRDCDIESAGVDGLTVEKDGDVTVSRSRVRDCKGNGVRLAEGARGSLMSCEITGNAGDGVLVASTEPIVVRDCVTRDNGRSGVRQTVPGPRLSVEDLESEGNAQADSFGTAEAVGERREPQPEPGAGEPPRTPAGEPPATGPSPAAAHPSAPATASGSVDGLLEKLEGLVGLAAVKKEVATLVNLTRLAKRRAEAGLPGLPMGRHLVFSGPPGTGKTTVARLYAGILAGLGALSSGHVVEVARADLVAQIIGGTAIKTTEKFNEAKGGVLFVDEAYTLVSGAGAGGGPDFGKEAIDTLVKLMEDHRDEVVVIAAGYTHDMRKFMDANPGLASRFTRTVEFENYEPAEMVTIVEQFCASHSFRLETEGHDALASYFGAIPRGDDFGNGRTARKVFEEMVDRQAHRLAEQADIDADALTRLHAADVPEVPGAGIGAGSGKRDAQGSAEVLAELSSMVGLASVKREVTDLVNLLGSVQQRRAAGLPAPSVSRHLVFSGNPGTGKTTVARLYAKLLTSLGILQRGQLVEVGRADLVGEYVGHTAQRTKDSFDRARGGLLFIDEAYALLPPGGGGTDFGREAIDTLVKLMEDHRDEVVVIAAGYTDEMKSFIAANPGLSSRFTQWIEFDDYAADELLTILTSQAARSGYELHEQAAEMLRAYFQATHDGRVSGNGRYARKVLDAMITAHARRISTVSAPSVADLRSLLPQDVTPVRQ
ncbi:right-handed parallel beta-helix repeat-containing protein [Streptomyces sp. NPDC001941]|uniref:right-handed parallel beta-helix repeat-containing protein n=1 Tax=Streptomyces sp. NPDC001941 TaxID=3154659 RepID=UPI003326BF7D